MTNELPPLPEPSIEAVESLEMGLEQVPYYSTQQMQEYARAAMAQAHKPLTNEQRLEVCAKAEAAMQRDQNLSWREALMSETEAAHGIKGGEQ